MIDLHDGLYEEVINQEMSKALQCHKESSVFKEKIDPEEAPSILSEYVAKIIKQKLLEVQEENDNSIDKQISVINRVIGSLSDDYDSSKVSNSGEQI